MTSGRIFHYDIVKKNARKYTEMTLPKVKIRILSRLTWGPTVTIMLKNKITQKISPAVAYFIQRYAILPRGIATK